MEKDPWYWVKVNASEIRHSLDFSPEPRTGGNVRSRLVEALSGIETDFIGNLTAVYSWVVPTTDLGKSFRICLTFRVWRSSAKWSRSNGSARSCSTLRQNNEYYLKEEPMPKKVSSDSV